ncbi:hypothetical protein L7F22_052221 [Adiantum nelumboides]|nr:hypothetical protein [Adiantum nelumboides]
MDSGSVNFCIVSTLAAIVNVLMDFSLRSTSGKWKKNKRGHKKRKAHCSGASSRASCVAIAKLKSGSPLSCKLARAARLASYWKSVALSAFDFSFIKFKVATAKGKISSSSKVQGCGKGMHDGKEKQQKLSKATKAASANASIPKARKGASRSHKSLSKSSDTEEEDPDTDDANDDSDEDYIG